MSLLLALAIASRTRPGIAPPPAPSPPRSAPIASPHRGLPPGWSYGVVLTSDGDRIIVALPPGVVAPAIEARSDPLQRAHGRLTMLRVALEAYYAGALTGVNQYPHASTLDQLAGILERQDLLPLGWSPGAPVVGFQLTDYRYQIAVRVAGQTIGIASPPAKNPYRMLLVLPHQP